MRRVKVPGLDIEIPPGSAFKIETPLMMPKMHLLAAVVAPRGYGKGVITTNLIEQLKVVDRLILVSPSAASNKALNDRLKRILAKEDMFDNPNDISVLDKIVAIVEKERDDYEEYWEKRRKYELLMKKMDSDTPLFQIPAEVLMASFDGKGFKPPEHAHYTTSRARARHVSEDTVADASCSVYCMREIILMVHGDLAVASDADLCRRLGHHEGA